LNVVNCIVDKSARRFLQKYLLSLCCQPAFHNAYVKLDAASDEEMRMGCHVIVKSFALPSKLVADSSELAIPN
jgi:hypothetical protein